MVLTAVSCRGGAHLQLCGFVMFFYLKKRKGQCSLYIIGQHLAELKDKSSLKEKAGRFVENTSVCKI